MKLKYFKLFVSVLLLSNGLFGSSNDRNSTPSRCFGDSQNSLEQTSGLVELVPADTTNQSPLHESLKSDCSLKEQSLSLPIQKDNLDVDLSFNDISKDGLFGSTDRQDRVAVVCNNLT